MNIYLSKNFSKAFEKLTKNNFLLKDKIKAKVKFFTENPKHPSLKLHKLKGKMVEDWSFSVEGDIRVVLTYIDDGVLFVDIGSHKEVYK
ncbi:type II toxin-antitoxin system mRNA interferase toxin, RelE/StbE family [Candidatus Roizmanbacteria bacterium CG_4_9_14_3_um_filter_33_18]|uniref:Type II toxin-antitoxin system mRNA interferase toxin, RelE/StbE family n=3 Tax=Candidatus Roizmaniibacteriota TaxID=1752723 RepID=A0A2H0KJT8_9BACT|nr:MAG: type II toxin-antitoxin system mRNA interferase toxin, RelE/StbE family [Candidatus Roizmanbacteria bacterium CG11_big_fil_rev_8_21_14_0_20_37_16]PIU36617.1 MAG: type II toxin-antitoxin system mRNA interferase toxin, RelE/StbE family [Candidatus Roizmanbacteria bacterium CG07_land_8_20_14_0_80_34_15]PJA55441.1 MAG: type II toxin-antitoxin system mRNA interferase toxin, RelE/StbE family [Candidatus Roizmanbacteria bacterium CG_4_9_14_3_um_filter_33_18]